MLGASRWRAFRAVTLPALRPAIAAAAAIVFLFTFTSFGVILILGGPRYATLETEIYRQTAQLLDLPLAAALTVVQLVAGRRCCSLVDRLDRGPPTRRAVGCARRAETAAPAAHRRRARCSSAPTSRVMALLLGAPLARARRAVARTRPAATASTSTARSASVHAGSTLFVPPVDAIAQLAAVRGRSRP